MAIVGGGKLTTFTKVAPNATVHSWWNNANAETYRLNAWPKVPSGVDASAEITRVSSRVHGFPPERELHFYVKNTGSTTIDIDVWAFWWNWTLRSALEDVCAAFKVPAVGGAIVTNQGIKLIDVTGIRKHVSTVPVEVGDRWHLGSDTKAMTATLHGVLAQKGAVGWDLTVAQAFPEWANTMKDWTKYRTFEMLMAHRSGIVNELVEETKALENTSVSSAECRRELARLITHRDLGGDPELAKSPGFEWGYHNTNFILAGAMLERCTGKSWEDLMKTEIFQPLGMTTAGFGEPDSTSNVNEPWGHTDKSGQREATKWDIYPGPGPAGRVHASLGDWAKFVRLHLDGSEGSLTLAPATLTRLHTEYPGNVYFPQRYGWGWRHDPGSGVRLGHDGSNGLWYCICQVILNDQVGFLAVTNIGDGEHGKGGSACASVIQKLKDWYYQPLP
jgi:CubicO group peptidase (beta-lactamase class C family)